MFKNLRLTTSMQFVLHSLLSLVIGAAIAGLTVLGQGLFATGSNPQVVLATGLSAFIAWFSHGFIALINNPQTLQAGLDSVKELQGQVTNLEASHSNLQNVVNTLVQAAQQPVQMPVQPVSNPAVSQIIAPPLISQGTNMNTSTLVPSNAALLQQSIPNLTAIKSQFQQPTP